MARRRKPCARSKRICRKNESQSPCRERLQGQRSLTGRRHWEKRLNAQNGEANREKPENWTQKAETSAYENPSFFPCEIEGRIHFFISDRQRVADDGGRGSIAVRTFASLSMAQDRFTVQESDENAAVGSKVGQNGNAEYASNCGRNGICIKRRFTIQAAGVNLNLRRSHLSSSSRGDLPPAIHIGPHRLVL